MGSGWAPAVPAGSVAGVVAERAAEPSPVPAALWGPAGAVAAAPGLARASGFVSSAVGSLTVPIVTSEVPPVVGVVAVAAATGTLNGTEGRRDVIIGVPDLAAM